MTNTPGGSIPHERYTAFINDMQKALGGSHDVSDVHMPEAELAECLSHLSQAQREEFNAALERGFEGTIQQTIDEVAEQFSQ